MKHGLKALALVVLLAGPHVEAASVYYDRAAFLAAVGSVISEGFESYATNTCTDGGPSPTNVFAGAHFNVTSTPTEGGTSFLCTGTAGAGPVPTEGNNALIAGSNTMDTWYLDFQLLNGPVFAVGFDVVDAAENGAALFANENGETATIANCCLNPGSTLFFGFISDTPFSRFTLTNTAHGDGWAIDQVALAASEVLDPGALLQQLLADVTGVGPGKILERTVAGAQVYYAVPDIQATCSVMRFFDFEVQLIWRLSNATKRSAPWKITTEQMDDLLGKSGSIQIAIGCN